MGEAHHRGLGDILVEHQCAFYLGSPHAMARYVEYVIHATRNAQVAVLVSQRAVTGKVIAGIGRKVGIDHALVIAIDGADLGGPGSLDHQIPRSGSLNLTALLIQQGRLHPEKGKAGKAGLERVRTG